MGVPAFFRWLTRKYPSVIVNCVEQKSVNVNGQSIPTQSSEPNPNGVEFDNLYLDMNGIIHPCTHPEDRPAPRNEDEMMVAIFECIDRLFNIVRPRKVLYMAIDGVAPRAKMNQQRSRRFRASKETMEKVREVQNIREELKLKGIELPPEKEAKEHFDSNCITPGTPFMARLSECLHYYIHSRLNNDPGWQGIKVILSDANVPGEGEHKIMDYIRKQRAQPDHDPNTQHCLCGADADLIMLGLATHEPNFTIIREEFKPNQPRPCEICAQTGHEMKDCRGVASVESDAPQAFVVETQYIFVRLNVLKEYLQRELQMPNLPFKYDFERAVDDWVFMCFFVGNDFLPHLPSLEIREDAIDRLVGLYKDCVYKTGGWLTDSGDVNLSRVQIIMLELGKVEDEIFKRRQQKELQFKARNKAKKRRMANSPYNQYRPNMNMIRDTSFGPRALGQASPVNNVHQEIYNIRKASMHSSANQGGYDGGQEGNAALDAMVRPAGSSPHGQKRKADDDEDSDDQAHDEVRLWEDGFKDRYYESKFNIGAKEYEFRNSVALHYVRGLCWVLRYYYQGCASWKWYFPYHYAPFASDFENISGLSTEFESDTLPFNPLEQLMSVFPAASSKHVPKPWAQLMSDIESPIIDFYPEDFKIDLNGKKFSWQGVALLPFVEEERLFKALKPYYDKLTPAEIKRNIRGDDRLYMSNKNKGYDFVNNLYINKVEATMECAISVDGMRGTVLLDEICISNGGYLDSPIMDLPPVSDNIVCTVRFRDPKYNKGFIFSTKKLNGAIDPPRVLKPQDLDAQASKNWRPQIGMVPSTSRATLDLSAHRALNHYTPKNPVYNSVPPPNFDNRNFDRDRYNQPQNRYDGNRRDNNYQGNMGGSYNTSGYYNRPYNQQDDGYQNRNNYNNYSNNPGNQNRRRPPGPYRDNYEASNRYNSRR